MADDDPINSLWDELHPPRRPLYPELAPFPWDAKVEPIKEIDGLDLAAAPHLVLAQTWTDLGRSLDRLRSLTHRRATVDELTSHLPCLIYGNDHWTNLQKGLDALQEDGRQAFIGTMNTFVVDCFYFQSAEDAESRILLPDSRARFYRMTPFQAERFYRGYQVGIEHVSAILRTEGIW